MAAAEQLTDEEIAERLFCAYNDQAPNPWRTFDGKTVPVWPELSDQVRGKWIAVARKARELAVLQHV